MPFDLHTVELVDGSTFTLYDRVLVGTQFNIATAAAGGAGDAVTVDVTFAAQLPSPNYGVQVTPSQACAVSVSNKASNGFTVTLSPLGSGVTLAPGSIDVLVWA
jgi:hypothetical protein